MRLIVKGNDLGPDTLPRAELPDGAVPFQEPEDPRALNRAILPYLIPVVLVSAGFVAAALLLHGPSALPFSPWAPAGCLLAFLCILPHELLHGIWFGRDAPVYLYCSPGDGMLFVISPRPVSKGRFIWLSLFPSLVFGALPLALWALALPQAAALAWMGFVSLTMGCGDFLNVHNALRQMPRGSMQVLSGFHSYWFMPGPSVIQ